MSAIISILKKIFVCCITLKHSIPLLLMTYKNNFVVVFPDDFNRVILPVKRGQEFTDYINASFIDVSSILSLLSLTH